MSHTARLLNSNRDQIRSDLRNSQISTNAYPIIKLNLDKVKNFVNVPTRSSMVPTQGKASATPPYGSSIGSTINQNNNAQ